MGALDGQHALVTGGGTGIGAAIARALAKEGAAVSLAGRRKEPLEHVAKELPKATAIIADVTRREDCTAMVEQARAAHGPVDIVIANAGGAESAPAAKITSEHWQRMIGVNLTGAFNTVQAALPDITRKDAQGRIVFTASTAGLKGYPYVAAYCAAKHGVIGLMRALALELAPTSVTVNAVCPGYTDTPMLAASVAAISSKTGRSEAEARAALAKDNADGELISPDAVAAKVLWLCLPQSRTINGEAIAITGAGQ
jgi:NAD(P)-dependent dehydrogenase (short-subunit alcohol dehydrogenase family)